MNAVGAMTGPGSRIDRPWESYAAELSDRRLLMKQRYGMESYQAWEQQGKGIPTENNKVSMTISNTVLQVLTGSTLFHLAARSRIVATGIWYLEASEGLMIPVQAPYPSKICYSDGQLDTCAMFVNRCHRGRVNTRLEIVTQQQHNKYYSQMQYVGSKLVLPEL